ncbi:MAG TPA: hypothetical protein VGB87_22160, partial [Vicinamibacteria bacterium]
WLSGKEHLRQRAYGPAREAFEACLRKDPHYAPALADLAQLRLRSMDPAGAFDLARRALAIDTYDPAANFAYGLAAAKLGRTADARDGFEVAAQSAELRGAAFTELARLSVRSGDFDRAALDAERSLDFNRRNLEALQVLALARRAHGKRDEAGVVLDTILALDPLSPFARFERARLTGEQAPMRGFAASFRGEAPQETLLELAAWYHGLGRLAETAEVLAVAPPTAEVLYWLARVKDEQGDAQAGPALQKAEAASPELVFPFRTESAEVLSWAAAKGTSWKAPYYLALVHWGAGKIEEARRLLEACGDAPDFAPFYATRALAFEDVPGGRAAADLERAARLDPRQWRYGRMLADRQLAAGHAAKGLATAADYAARFPASYILGMLHAKALLANGRAAEAASRLARLNVIPYEGSSEGRRLHREAHQRLAVAALRKGDAATARRAVATARLWPENLGAGKPYESDVDERLEDFLAAQALDRAGRKAEARALLGKVEASGARDRGASALVRALALRQGGREVAGRTLLADWSAREPGNTVATWAARAFAGEGQPPPDRAGEDARVLAAWLAGR